MGLVASAIFAGRNIDKCKNQHEYTRGAVAACQSVSSVESAVNTASSVFGNATKNASTAFTEADGIANTLCEKIGTGAEGAVDGMVKSSSVTSKIGKIGAVAQKAINPLLCVASGVRVLKDDDQYARLIEEVSAMGAMFGAEAVMKHVRSGVTGASVTGGFSKKVSQGLSNSKGLSKVLNNLHESYKNIGKTKNGNVKQTLIRIGMDVLFAAGSICAFNLGQKLGTKLSHREEEKENQTQKTTQN